MPSRAALLAATATALAAAGPARAGVAELGEVPLSALRGLIQTDGLLAETPRGLEVEVDGRTHLLLPLRGAREVELDVVTDAPILLSWGVERGGRSLLGYPPIRYRALERGATRVALDLREAAGWGAQARPVLLLDGTAHVVVAALRASAPAPSEEQARAEADHAALWRSELVAHTTVNFLTQPLWSASEDVPLADVLAGAASAVFVAALGGLRLARRGWRPGPALAAAALFLVGAHGVHAVLRFLPAWNLAPVPDPEARIREHYPLAPQLGPLAALARATIGEGERVGVVGDPRDWFGPQTLCFNLAPRPCVLVRPGEAVHRGISGVGSLRPDELDVLVSYRAPAPSPPGFAPVAAVSRAAFVARRR